MTTYIINDFVAFDDFEIQRTVTIPSGTSIQKAWFTIKKKFIDLDSSAIISKLATSVQSSEGWVESVGSGGIGLVHFYLTPAETGMLTPYSEYPYSIKIQLATSLQVSTPETGLIIASPAVRRGII